MKNILGLIMIVVCLALFQACKNTPDRPDPVTSQTNSTVGTPAATPPPAVAAQAGAPGVAHYICPTSCGFAGADAGGVCPDCGGTLTHNQAFHANDATPPVNNLANQIPDPANPQITPPPATAPGPNANGVYHYTCAKGCAGGGDGAGPCGSCGEALAHNAAFHN